jgi:hypothetical protein
MGIANGTNRLVRRAASFRHLTTNVGKGPSGCVAPRMLCGLIMTVFF